MSSAVPGPGAEINGDGRSGVPAGMESPISPREAERLAEATLELARVLDPEAIGATGSFGIGDAAALRGRQDRALLSAKSAIDASYRRVVEDDDTIERLAQAMWFGPPEWTRRIVQQEYAPTWRAKARAVVRALQDETQAVELCQGCGNPTNESLHGMSEFGGCV